MIVSGEFQRSAATAVALLETSSPGRIPTARVADPDPPAPGVLPVPCHDAPDRLMGCLAGCRRCASGIARGCSRMARPVSGVRRFGGHSALKPTTRREPALPCLRLERKLVWPPSRTPPWNRRPRAASRGRSPARQPPPRRKMTCRTASPSKREGRSGRSLHFPVWQIRPRRVSTNRSAIDTV